MVDITNIATAAIALIAGGGGHAVLTKGKKKVTINVDDIVNKVLDGLRSGIAKEVEGVLSGLDSVAKTATDAAETVAETPTVTPSTEGESAATATPAPAETTPAAPASTPNVPLSGVVQLLNDLRLDATGDNVVKVVNFVKSVAKDL